MANKSKGNNQQFPARLPSALVEWLDKVAARWSVGGWAVSRNDVLRELVERARAAGDPPSPFAARQLDISLNLAAAQPESKTVSPAAPPALSPLSAIALGRAQASPPAPEASRGAVEPRAVVARLRRAHASEEKLQVSRRRFSDGKVGEAMGVHRNTVAAWRKGAPTSGSNTPAMPDGETAKRLNDWLTAQGAPA